MNYFVEGLQGSGKSTKVEWLKKKYADYQVFHEWDYSPVDLSWCAYVDESVYQDLLQKYAEVASEIEKKTVTEGDKRVINYTQVITDIPGFHKDLEQYEIFNGHLSADDFKDIILSRFAKWQGDCQILECSIFQNVIQELLLFYCETSEEIMDFYRELSQVLAKKQYRILYLETMDVAESLTAVRKERVDDQGNEMWFPMMCAYFEETPYAKAKGLTGFEGLVEFFKYRQELELQILQELFDGRFLILKSKINNYVFDLYGTLLDLSSDEKCDSTWEKWFVELEKRNIKHPGLNRFREDFFAVDKRNRIRQKEQSGCDVPEIDIIPVYRELFKAYGNGILDDETLNDVSYAFRSASRAHIGLYPGVVEYLTALMEFGANVYLLSNAQRSYTWPEIEMFGIDKLTHDQLISSDYGVMKPDRRFFEVLLNRYNLKRDETLMHGDSLESDIKGAMAAGVKYVHLIGEKDPHTYYVKQI